MSCPEHHWPHDRDDCPGCAAADAYRDALKEEAADWKLAFEASNEALGKLQGRIKALADEWKQAAASWGKGQQTREKTGKEVLEACAAVLADEIMPDEPKRLMWSAEDQAILEKVKQAAKRMVDKHRRSFEKLGKE